MPKTYRLLALLAAGLGLGCGGAQTPATNHSGTYHGPNELDFLVTAPVRRQMPPEIHNGAAEVLEDTGDEVTLELRMIEGGDVCRIAATRPTPESTLQVNPGQECRSRFAYEGAPTAAVVTIEEGTVEFGEDSVEVQLSGSFVAATTGATQSEGVARWRFEGTR